MVEKRNAYEILVGKLERKRPLQIPRRTWNDDIKSILGIRFRGVKWIHLIQTRVMW